MRKRKTIKFTKSITDTIERDRLLSIVETLVVIYPSVEYDGWGSDGSSLDLFMYSIIDEDFLLLQMDITCLGFSCQIRKQPSQRIWK
jgi:hypothetical protein